MTEQKKTDAWMPLWIGAYLADTQHLERHEHGAYFLLMMAYWRNGGPLLDEDKRLAAITKATAKEWKTLRTTMAEFFTVADGVWSHKRIEQELASSKQNSERASSKAKAAAQARWKHTDSDASSNAPSMLQALPDECPTPTPTPSSNKPTLVAKDEIELQTHTSRVTEPGQICKAMKAAGIGDVNPGHPELLMLLNAGATIAEFEGAATTAAKKGKGFAYALGTLKRTRQDAANTAPTLHTGALPVATGETEYQRNAREKMTGWAPSIAAKAPGQSQPLTVLEAEYVAAIGSH